ncbi:hypothetical protein K0M31_000806 [Melipona bicolor]|uniref:Uncharacterized protein n=1 Tax=Melipona bicolor TaxID=60889 RepID=A0AA40GE88_9HYME|nr:hypothetical protein K0M31_000806 [Melipona bicolor]
MEEASSRGILSCDNCRANRYPLLARLNSPSILNRRATSSRNDSSNDDDDGGGSGGGSGGGGNAPRPSAPRDETGRDVGRVPG